MKGFTPSPLLCLVVFVAGALVAFLLGWWFACGLLAGWASLLAFAVFTGLGEKSQGGAP